MRATLVFPHQLFASHPAIVKGNAVFLIEDHLFFKQYHFHAQKIVLHRASMKAYEQLLRKKKLVVRYVEVAEADLQGLFAALQEEEFSGVDMVDPVDYLLMRRVKRYARQYRLPLNIYPTPNFITPAAEWDNFFARERKLLMADFYRQQRKRLNILMEGDRPVGGKWSFDTENRKQLPASVRIPSLPTFETRPEVAEAWRYTEKYFPHAPGSREYASYPITHAEAEKLLDDFLDHRLARFGEYEDAIARQHTALFHSQLTPALNIGLLSPAWIIERTLQKHKQRRYPLNSLEGFIRQVIGWREFMRGVYQHHGVRQRTANYWQLTHPLPASFYSATTGVEPVDDVIKKVLRTGYCHHIERLMVLGNFMHLCGLHPDGVYRWFMELFIDAYDWVMVPNVYGMSQYADGGLMTTKPYVSGSNYILKMSDYKKGPWCEVWDGLYWNYIHTHAATFAKNPRMSMVVNLAKKMPEAKMNLHKRVASDFLRSLQ
jgi:deoxyribodipyrimidine photolyase-related protein